MLEIKKKNIYQMNKPTLKYNNEKVETLSGFNHLGCYLTSDGSL